VQRIGLIGSVLAVAIVFAALGAASASAKTTLVLTEEEGGPPLMPGAPVGMYIEFQEPECEFEGSALLSINHETKDILTGSSSVTLCDDSETPSGGISEVQLTTSGKATIRTTPGNAVRLDPYLEGCVYEFTKLSGTFIAPEISTISGEAKGKLSKTYTTVKGCEKKLTTEFTLFLEAGGELLTT
jgi:hypothetical protein